jgi:hypothetical protein
MVLGSSGSAAAGRLPAAHPNESATGSSTSKKRKDPESLLK